MIIRTSRPVAGHLNRELAKIVPNNVEALTSGRKQPLTCDFSRHRRMPDLAEGKNLDQNSREPRAVTPVGGELANRALLMPQAASPAGDSLPRPPLPRDPLQHPVQMGSVLDPVPFEYPPHCPLPFSFSPIRSYFLFAFEGAEGWFSVWKKIAFRLFSVFGGPVNGSQLPSVPSHQGEGAREPRSPPGRRDQKQAQDERSTDGRVAARVCIGIKATLEQGILRRHRNFIPCRCKCVWRRIEGVLPRKKVNSLCNDGNAGRFRMARAVWNISAHSEKLEVLLPLPGINADVKLGRIIICDCRGSFFCLMAFDR